MDFVSKTAFIAVAGPSGVGKGTILRRLFDKYPTVFELSVSYTSRAPRTGEVDGVHYHFRNKEEILAAVDAGEFLEHALVHGNVYGTAVKEVERIKALKKVCVLEIDVQGLKQVVKSTVGSQGRYVVIEPPNHEILEQRLRGRGTETEEKVQTRLKNAIWELEELSGMDKDLIIVNQDLEDSVATLLKYVEEWYPEQIAANTSVAASAASEATPAEEAEAETEAAEAHSEVPAATPAAPVAAAEEVSSAAAKKSCCVLQH